MDDEIFAILLPTGRLWGFRYSHQSAAEECAKLDQRNGPGHALKRLVPSEAIESLTNSIAKLTMQLERKSVEIGQLSSDLKTAQELNASLNNQIGEFQRYVLQKSEQVRTETALRVEAEKRLADIVEILEPLDPPDGYAAVVDKIAILATPERYACDPIESETTKISRQEALAIAQRIAETAERERQECRNNDPDSFSEQESHYQCALCGKGHFTLDCPEHKSNWR